MNIIKIRETKFYIFSFYIKYVNTELTKKGKMFLEV